MIFVWLFDLFDTPVTRVLNKHSLSSELDTCPNDCDISYGSIKGLFFHYVDKWTNTYIVHRFDFVITTIIWCIYYTEFIFAYLFLV